MTNLEYIKKQLQDAGTYRLIMYLANYQEEICKSLKLTCDIKIKNCNDCLVENLKKEYKEDE